MNPSVTVTSSFLSSHHPLPPPPAPTPQKARFFLQETLQYPYLDLGEVEVCSPGLPAPLRSTDLVRPQWWLLSLDRGKFSSRYKARVGISEVKAPCLDPEIGGRHVLEIGMSGPRPELRRG